MRRRRGVDDAGRDRAGARDAGGSRGVRRRRRHLRRDGDYIVVVVFVIRILVGWFVVFNRIVDSGRFARAVPPRPRRGRVRRHRRAARLRAAGRGERRWRCARGRSKISNPERRRGPSPSDASSGIRRTTGTAALAPRSIARVGRCRRRRGAQRVAPRAQGGRGGTRQAEGGRTGGGRKRGGGGPWGGEGGSLKGEEGGSVERGPGRRGG